MEPVDLNNVPTSQYIDQEGEHNVVVVQTSDHYFQSGGVGFALKMQDANGRIINDRVVVAATTLWKLKQIAEAAGLDEQQQARFTHNQMLGRCVQITTIKDENNPQYQRIVKYGMSDVEVVPVSMEDLEPMSEQAPPPKTKTASDEVPF